jgi:hypothetical protein
VYRLDACEHLLLAQVHRDQELPEPALLEISELAFEEANAMKLMASRSKSLIRPERTLPTSYRAQDVISKAQDVLEIQSLLCHVH